MHKGKALQSPIDGYRSRLADRKGSFAARRANTLAPFIRAPLRTAGFATGRRCPGFQGHAT